MLLISSDREFETHPLGAISDIYFCVSFLFCYNILAGKKDGRREKK